MAKTFVGRGSPTARQYLYSEMNLINGDRQRGSQNTNQTTHLETTLLTTDGFFICL